eukprot:6455968-Amphidinium_carterae.2
MSTLYGGDWNFKPDEFPITLARGDTLVPPPSKRRPIGRKLDWFLISPSVEGTYIGFAVGPLCCGTKIRR